jgi:hypothetical protein
MDDMLAIIVKNPLLYTSSDDIVHLLDPSFCAAMGSSLSKSED